mmetsp:Transcript_16431/g.27854  ORF Transcript_16431/g.27854 Transcript_16431/m.27854 type:complete len:95 (+) Transcript_16431:255-539(+)
MLAVCLIQIYHYSISMESNEKLSLSLVEIMVKDLAVFIIVYFVFKNACKPLGSQDKRKWMKLLMWIFVTGLPINLFFMSKVFLQISQISKDESE